MEWDGTPYHSLNWEIRKQFGKKLYKISLDGGMTCPNRDGTVGYGGCIFCSEGGSGDFAADRELSVREQLKTAKERIRDKLPKGKPGGYIAYFQAFTNTYAPAARLETLFTEAMEDEEVEVLSIATRPDCLPDGVLELLGKLNQRKPVWIELGLQTASEKNSRMDTAGLSPFLFYRSEATSGSPRHTCDCPCDHRTAGRRRSRSVEDH